MQGWNSKVDKVLRPVEGNALRKQSSYCYASAITKRGVAKVKFHKQVTFKPQNRYYQGCKFERDE